MLENLAKVYMRDQIIQAQNAHNFSCQKAATKWNSEQGCDDFKKVSGK